MNMCSMCCSTAVPETGTIFRCPYCGLYHGSGMVCPRIKEIEYYPDGRIKKVVLREERESPW